MSVRKMKLVPIDKYESLRLEHDRNITRRQEDKTTLPIKKQIEPLHQPTFQVPRSQVFSLEDKTARKHKLKSVVPDKDSRKPVIRNIPAGLRALLEEASEKIVPEKSKRQAWLKM